MSHSLRETLSQAGYRHYQTLPGGEHVLQDVETGELELWFCNKGHASYGIIYKNTHLEFARNYPGDDHVPL